MMHRGFMRQREEKPKLALAQVLYISLHMEQEGIVCGHFGSITFKPGI
jgi:hypothetical protein